MRVAPVRALDRMARPPIVHAMFVRRLTFLLLAALIFGQLASPTMAHAPRPAMMDMGAMQGHDGCAAGHPQEADDGDCSRHAGPGAAGCCVTACAAFIWLDAAAPTPYQPTAANPRPPALALDAPSRSVEPPRRPPRAAS